MSYSKVRMSQALRDRLHAAFKGTNPFAKSDARVIQTVATMRDQSSNTIRSAQIVASLSGGSGVVSITDGSGNRLALLDTLGFADGCILS